MEEADARHAHHTWAVLGVRRFPIVGLLYGMWELRRNLTADDAHLALAEALGGDLLTADARLAGAAGPTCPIRLVRP